MVTRHMLSAAALLLGLVVAGCSTRSKVAPGSGGVLLDGMERSSLGYLQHRGRVYRLEDLLDPRFRAASDDPFVQQLRLDKLYASWAGL
jgi:hypothetical protein